MTSEPADDRQPFLGLRPFEEDDEDLFFGRETQVDELVGRLRRRRFIAVVGTSGSGKSSLVRAGLLPTLHGGFMAGRGSRWFIATMRPGTSPIASILTALERSGALGEATSDDPVRRGLARAALDRGALGLVELLRDVGLERDANVLIVVDQFEELFRYTQDEPAAAAAFVKLLMEAAAYEDLPIYVVLTMRSDFLGDCARFSGLPEVINDGLYLVPRMSWDQLRRAIEGPIGVAGADTEPALVTRLLNDLGDNADALPVLQHALMLTWDLRADRSMRPTLTVDDYARTGGLDEALSRHGDAVYTALDAREQKIAERLFKAITERGTDNRGIRRPTRFGDLRAIVEALPEELRTVIEVFRAPGTSFLTAHFGSIDDDSVIDITHESLMRTWGRLERWVDEEAESTMQYRRLAADAVAHAAGTAALWRDPDLWNAERWRAQHEPNSAWARHVDAVHSYDAALGFLDASVRERSLGEAARRRRRRSTGALLISAILILSALAAWAVEQRWSAQVSQSQFLARDAEGDVSQGDAVTGMLVALQALPPSMNGFGRPVVQTAEYVLEDAVANQRERLDLRGHDAEVNSAAYSPDGRRIVSGSRDHSVRVWDAASGSQIAVLRGHRDHVIFAAFSPDGRRIVSASRDGTVRVWNAAGGGQVLVLHGTAEFHSATFSPDGRRIVSASEDQTVRIWSAADGAQVAVLRGHSSTVNSAAFSPDGRRIVSASDDKTVRIWDAATGTQIAVLRGHDKPVNSAAFSPDGRHVVSGSDDKIVRIWDAAGGAQIAALRGHDDAVNAVAYSPDGNRIISASDDDAVRIWDSAGGTLVAILRGHDSWVRTAAFSPDGRQIVSASDDRTIRLWDFATRAQIAVLRIRGDTFRSAAFSPDGRRIVSASDDKLVRVWDSTTGTQIAVLRGHEDVVRWAAFSPDGRRIVSASQDKTARIWDAATGARIAVLRGHGDALRMAVFSPDGRRIVTASKDKTARIWDAATGAQVAVLRHDDWVRSAAFSPDGRRVVTASEDSTVRVWDGTTGAQTGILRGHEAGVSSAVFSPDGRRIVSASRDKTVRVWDAATGASIAVLRGDWDVVNSVAFSPDGRRIVGASNDKTMRIWDADNGTQIAVLHGHDDVVESADLSPDGRRIVSASNDGTVRMWDVSLHDQGLIDAARARVPRQLTDEQRKAEFLTP